MVIGSPPDANGPPERPSPRAMKSVEELVKLAMDNHATTINLDQLNGSMRDIEHRLRLQPMHVAMDPKVPIE